MLTESEYCIPRNYVDTFTCYLTSPISEVQFWLRGNCRISTVPTTRPFLPLRAAQTVVMLTVLHTQSRHSTGTVQADRWTCNTAKYLCLDMQISADMQTLANIAFILHMNSFSGVMQSKQRRSSSIHLMSALLAGRPAFRLFMINTNQL